jgi:hypothetical protein
MLVQAGARPVQRRSSKVKRVWLVAVVAGVALTAPGSAAAKGPNFARLCGASGCTTLRGETAVQPLLSWWYTPFFQRGAPAPAPFYRIRITDPSGVKWSLLYVPARHAVRFWQNRVPPYHESIGPYWRSVPGSAVAVMGRLVHKLKPYAAPRRWPR